MKIDTQGENLWEQYFHGEYFTFGFKDGVVLEDGSLIAIGAVQDGGWDSPDGNLRFVLNASPLPAQNRIETK